MADTELMVLSKSKRWEDLRRGAGLEVSGRPVLQWNTMEAAESKDLRNLALSNSVGTSLPEQGCNANSTVHKLHM